MKKEIYKSNTLKFISKTTNNGVTNFNYFCLETLQEDEKQTAIKQLQSLLPNLKFFGIQLGLDNTISFQFVKN